VSSLPPNTEELVWEIATLYPPQGTWSDEGYLSLTASTNRLIEFTDGRIEFLTMPTKSHQLILMFLLDALRGLVTARNLGVALPAPLRVRIRQGKYREPDIVFMRAVHAERAGEEFFDGADLVMEIVSEDAESRKRDLSEKVHDYAEALIPEYWIVDPVEGQITVCSQPEPMSGYKVRQVFARNEIAISPLLDGFVIDVAEALESGKGTGRS
jgi:Uma2 family endonuclease